MPNPRPGSSLENSLNGVASAGLPDRTFGRGQGCWNCIHSKDPVNRWFDKRPGMLARGVHLAEQSLMGEKHPIVIQIRRAVAAVDQAIAHRGLFVCDVGLTATGEPVGDFVASAYLCSRWTGRDGASLARGPDGKLDDLPEELRDKLDGSQPFDLEKFVAAADPHPPGMSAAQPEGRWDTLEDFGGES
jgi:hypothetical protein